MLSAGVVDAVQARPVGRIPPNEAQARPLTKLSSPEAQQEAWKAGTKKTARRRLGGDGYGMCWPMFLIVSCKICLLLYQPPKDRRPVVLYWGNKQPVMVHP